MKTNKETYFIQLGMRKNGKIVKNEQYGVTELRDKLFERLTAIEPITAWDRFWKTKKYMAYVRHDSYCEGYSMAEHHFRYGIADLIDKDVKGKGTKK